MYKVFATIMVMTLSVMAFAAEKAPAPFTDSKIERKLNNGKIQEFDGNEYIIVRRGAKKASPKPATPIEIVKVVEVVKKVEVIKTVEVEKANKKNRVSLMAGSGPRDGLDRSLLPTEVVVESRVGAVGGVQYQRLLNNSNISLGAQVQTNKSALIEIGLDF